MWGVSVDWQEQVLVTLGQSRKSPHQFLTLRSVSVTGLRRAMLIVCMTPTVQFEEITGSWNTKHPPMIGHYLNCLWTDWQSELSASRPQSSSAFKTRPGFNYNKALFALTIMKRRQVGKYVCHEGEIWMMIVLSGYLRWEYMSGTHIYSTWTNSWIDGTLGQQFLTPTSPCLLLLIHSKD